MIVDLGCGTTKRAAVGVDCVSGPGVDHVIWLGFEPLPFPAASVDVFLAWDVLEHLPQAVWQIGPGGPTVHRPRIALLREIHRCLVPGGLFKSATPVADPAWAQDPTHEAPPWVEETWEYYCGGMGTLPAQYGIDFAFALVARERRGHHLYVTVQKRPED